MENKIIKFLKEEILNKTPTTKDLVYKEKVIDIHNIDNSYKKMVIHNEEWKDSGLKYGTQSLYFNESAFFHAKKFETLLFKETNKRIEFKYFMDKIQINEIFNSLWIEGVRSSKKDIRQFLKKQPFKDVTFESQIARNYHDALQFVLTTRIINENSLFALYLILTKDIDMKENQLDGMPYRKGEVQIGESKNGRYQDTGLSPEQIKPAMDAIFKKISSITLEKNTDQIISTIIAIHYMFELIHPYYDMNGRMGRLLVIWMGNILGLKSHTLFISEAINNNRKLFYYDAFTKSNLNGFKYDATYFVNSILAALISEKINYLIIEELESSIKLDEGKKFSELERTILSSLLVKEFKFFKAQEIILGMNSYNKGQISTAFKNLEKYKIIQATNTKPKEYALIWNNTMEGVFKYFLMNLKDAQW